MGMWKQENAANTTILAPQLRLFRSKQTSSSGGIAHIEWGSWKSTRLTQAILISEDEEGSARGQQ